jgi:prevent-host-death family protein
MSRTIGSRELRTRLGTYLRLVRRGLSFVITDRGRPVARLGPIEAAADTAGRLQDLEATGQVSRASSKPLSCFRAVALRGAPLSSTILGERGDRP